MRTMGTEIFECRGEGEANKSLHLTLGLLLDLATLSYPVEPNTVELRP